MYFGRRLTGVNDLQVAVESTVKITSSTVSVFSKSAGLLGLSFYEFLPSRERHQQCNPFLYLECAVQHYGGVVERDVKVVSGAHWVSTENGLSGIRNDNLHNSSTTRGQLLYQNTRWRQIGSDKLIEVFC